jgi:hypothetical protein
MGVQASKTQGVRPQPIRIPELKEELEEAAWNQRKLKTAIAIGKWMRDMAAEEADPEEDSEAEAEADISRKLDEVILMEQLRKCCAIIVEAETRKAVRMDTDSKYARKEIRAAKVRQTAFEAMKAKKGWEYATYLARVRETQAKLEKAKAAQHAAMWEGWPSASASGRVGAGAEYGLEEPSC